MKSSQQIVFVDIKKIYSAALIKPLHLIDPRFDLIIYVTMMILRFKLFGDPRFDLIIYVTKMILQLKLFGAIT